MLESVRSDEDQTRRVNFIDRISLVIDADNKIVMKKSNRDWRNGLGSVEAPRAAQLGTYDNDSHVRVTARDIGCLHVGNGTACLG